MSDKAKSILIYSTLLVVLLFFFFWGLVKAKAFLAPLTVAVLLAMVIVPVCHWFESKGISRGWASLFSDLIVLLFFVLLAGVVAAQVRSLAQDWPQIKERVQPKIVQLQEFIASKTGLSVKEQDQNIEQYLPFGSSADASQLKGKEGKDASQQDTANTSSGSQAASADSSAAGSGSMLMQVGNLLGKFFSFLGTFLLVFVYIFFFLLYREKFKKSILKIVPQSYREQSQEVITKSAKVAQNYLFGRLLLILILAVLYSIGLSVSGVKQAILISILAALLSLIPYIGNILGFVLALGMAFISGSGLTGAVGVTITFAIAQFVESYILEPYIVGDKVSLNPVMVIVVVVLGGAVWGVIGMLIAIPALGVAKVVFDHVPVLNPLGYLLGEEDIGDDEEGEANIFTKTKRWALRKFGKA